MIAKIKEMPVKAILIICGTILAVVSMVTGVMPPDWIIKLLAVVGM